MGDGKFIRITNSSSGTITRDGGASVGCAWGDYDNDGHLDLFVANYSGQNNFLYQNNGDGTFTKIASGRIVTDGGSSEGGIWGDYDNDGFLDLYVTNPREKNFLYHNNRDGTFTRVTNSSVGSIVDDIGPSGGCAWADYDNDGFLDLFVANLNQKSWLYHNNGDGTFSKITSGHLVNDIVASAGCGWADYDNNGFPDLFIANGWEVQSQNSSLHRNNGNSNSWINIRCVGTVSNRSAIGAKVRVTAYFRGATREQMRELSGGSGYLSQNELRASFGLGDATNIDTVRIEWPSGIVQELSNVAVKQFLTVTEPPRLQALGIASDGFQLMLTGGIGFRYDIETSSNLVAWTPWMMLTNAARTMSILDPATMNSPKRFYRTVLLP